MPLGRPGMYIGRSRSPLWSNGYPRIPLALVREFDSHRVEILTLFAKPQ